MTKFRIVIETRAFEDIQDAILYYNQQQPGLGKHFLNAVNNLFSILNEHPFYQIRYDDVRCLPIKKFPYMAHFTVDEAQFIVKVYALVNTHRNPDKFWKK